ncbi:MAG: DNA-binding response regulator [Nostoc sp.]|uniref:response regulator transcription factor n=1 Tax=Nostoc sp. TaxID=1180 RepID=UPI002FF52B90
MSIKASIINYNIFGEEKSVKKILVIEDTASTRNLFLEGIKAKGFYTIGAENGLIGVQRANEELPDLIVSEIMIPKLNGYGVLTTLRQNPLTATIPFIFVTVRITRTDIRKGMELGADDYLTKPCTVEELLRAIAVCLEKRAFLQQQYAVQPQIVAEPPLADIIKPAAFECIFPSNHQLNKVFSFIEANYHRPITLKDVAVAVGYCPTYLTNLVQKQTGQTVQNWIIQRRMLAARSLLLETDQKIEAIATLVGYQCMVHFFRQFRQHHGTTPQAWRRASATSSLQKHERSNCYETQI